MHILFSFICSWYLSYTFLHCFSHFSFTRLLLLNNSPFLSSWLISTHFSPFLFSTSFILIPLLLHSFLLFLLYILSFFLDSVLCFKITYRGSLVPSAQHDSHDSCRCKHFLFLLFSLAIFTTHITYFMAHSFNVFLAPPIVVDVLLTCQRWPHFFRCISKKKHLSSYIRVNTVHRYTWQLYKMQRAIRALQENQSKITANQNSMWAEYLCGKRTEFATTEQNII